MMSSVYKINKGINKSIEFKGLKAQYIWYLGGGIIVLLFLFAVLYLVGVNALITIVIVGLAGVGVFVRVYKLSNKYGEHGMKKKVASRNIPRVLKCHSRIIFIRFK